MLNSFNSFQSPCSSDRDPDTQNVQLTNNSQSKDGTYFLSGIEGFTSPCDSKTGNMTDKIVATTDELGGPDILITHVTSSGSKENLHNVEQ
ncbi:hypothetical protein KC678_01990 [Candidatus Dojkabacteria bacterium]|uniref:Uncharacterized protein n=1 Tax=Candidatus Dojkabacteria bacterium TaxID=2099670 RepID=A0A955I8R5_9BACT|nr:hypothetical protein [Candidatus Dojkabacteria bacterium]